MTVDQYRESRQGEQKSRRGRILLIAVVVAAMLVGALGWYIGVGRYVDTPQLVGSTEAEAEIDAERAGFTFTVGKREFSETAPLGVVMNTNPEPGANILPDSTIEGVVSKGKERYEIPDLEGKTLDEASAALDELNLEIGDTSTAFNEEIDKGRVIKPADLEVGSLVKRNTALDLVLSKGRKPIDIVDHAGKPGSEATDALEKAGFRVDVDRAYSDDVDKGRVISQSPNSGNGFRGDTITLKVSRGPEDVAVPNVIGKPKNEATKILEDAGFKTRSIGEGNFTVRLQNPSEGRKLKVGSSVTILGF